MWLLDARDIDVTGKPHLKSFKEKDLPPYAILSHTWIEDDSGEVSFQDMKSGLIKEKLGYEKILNCCLKAKDEGLQYCWIDSCCINKDSSTELSEAINSMFLWYKQARICYAYLPDVHASCAEINTQFIASRWFKRGWTLQELIAPKQVVFFGHDWEYIGTKASMYVQISRATGITCEYLLEGERVKTASVAARMSWAAKRETTREEDLAYCLLGIFGVSMSLMYGEREKAFVRLQEEIAKEIDDQSLFAWESSEPNGYCGILARSPRDFLNSSTIQVTPGYLNFEPVTITNLGMKFYMPFIRGEETEGHFLGLLYCKDSTYDNGAMIGLRLRSTQGTLDWGEQLERLPDSELVRLSGATSDALQHDEMTVFIAKKGLSIESSSIRINRQNPFDINIDYSQITGECSIGGFYPPCQQVVPAPASFSLYPLSYGFKHVVIGVKQPDQRVLYLAFGFGCRPNKTENTSAYWFRTVDDNNDPNWRPQELEIEAAKESRLVSESDLASRLREIWNECDRSVKWPVDMWGAEIENGRYSIELSIRKEHKLGMVHHEINLLYLGESPPPSPLPSRNIEVWKNATSTSDLAIHSDQSSFIPDYSSQPSIHPPFFPPPAGDQPDYRHVLFPSPQPNTPIPISNAPPEKTQKPQEKSISDWPQEFIRILNGLRIDPKPKAVAQDEEADSVGENDHECESDSELPVAICNTESPITDEPTSKISADMVREFHDAALSQSGTGTLRAHL